jgi:hypothetical protein
MQDAIAGIDRILVTNPAKAFAVLVRLARKPG